MSRTVVQTEPGVLRIDQRIRVHGREIGTDVSGPACVYAQVQVIRGTVAYRHGRACLAAPRRFELFLPRFSIVQAVLERCDVVSIALVFRARPVDAIPQHPAVLPWCGDRPLSSRDDALQRLGAAGHVTPVPRAPAPTRLAASAKEIIDAHYATPARIGHIARRLHISPATLSRTFKKAYGIPPVRYRHQVRILDAITRFAEGEAPASVFQDVGFDDLSRFYKIFRKVACAAPGSYRPARSRNAKTRTW